MTMTIQEKIPVCKFDQFHQILCETGGRYICNPQIESDQVFVYYEAGDYELHKELWRRATTDIVEIRKDQRWRMILRRICLPFRLILRR